MIGAGPAGCAAAARLLDDGLRVLLLEEGPGPNRPPAVVSLDALGAVDADGWTRPDVRIAGGAAGGGPYWVGRGVGGGSAVNAMVLTAAGEGCHDEWVRSTGDDGWSAARHDPHRETLLDRLPTMTAEPGPLGAAVAEALADLGGVAPAHLAAQPAGRVSLFDALLGPPSPSAPVSDGRSRSGLGVVSGHPPRVDGLRAGLELGAGKAVRRLVADAGGGRIRGVETVDRDLIEADLVVVCTGALGSPRLVDSVVPSGASAAPSIAAPAARPLMDHPSFAFTVALAERARVGPEARPPVSVVARSAPGGAAVVIHVLDHVGAHPDGRAHGAVVIALARPSGWGTVSVADAATVVRPTELAGTADGAALAAAVRAVGERLGGPEVAAVATSVSLDDVGTPLAALDRWSDEDLAAWLADHPGPVRHPTSTLSPLGPGSTVLELPAGLVVADGSVLPTVPDANPQLPIMVNAWRLLSDVLDPD